MTELLERRFDLHLLDSKRHLRFPFEVPQGLSGLRVTLEFSPPGAGEVRTLINFTLLERTGPEGAALSKTRTGPEGGPAREVPSLGQDSAALSKTRGAFRGNGHRHGARHEAVLTEAWATPGFLPGPIQAGDWEIVVHTHMVADHTQVRLVIEALEQVPQAALQSPLELDTALERAAPPTQGWMLGDLHAHSTHSDARWTVSELARAARARGLAFLALTDHNTLSGRAELERIAPDLLLLPGFELTTYFGHAVALGLDAWLDWTVLEPGRGTLTLSQEVARAGGVLTLAHPFAPGDPFCTGCAWTYFDLRPENATHVEVWNGLWSGRGNRAALEHWYGLLEKGLRVLATVGTDIHGPPYQDGHGFTCTPRTSSRETLLEQLRRGNTYLARSASLEPRIRTSAGEAMLGSVQPSGLWTLELRWAGLPQGASLHIVADGARQVEALEPEGHWSGPLEVARWLHLEVWRADGELELLSNPVWAE